MGFQAPITVRAAVDALEGRRYVLPSIQRELVWDEEQMVLLWDSLLRRYPIGSFLFWQVNEDRRDEYQFYEFIRDYHERDHQHNPKADVSGRHGALTAVLDGQQRLTTLYLGLKGSRADRKKWARRADPEAYPRKTLHLDLSAPSQDEDRIFNFRFLDEYDAEEAAESKPLRWFPIGRILNMPTIRDVMHFLDEQGFARDSFAFEAISALHAAVHSDQSINFYLEEEQRLEKVLDIFIRINNGGEKLTYSDLLLSIATAQWTRSNARDVILRFVDDLSRLVSGLYFDRDFVLKACLVLNDISSVRFKVENFNRGNMKRIEDGWEHSSAALRMAVECAAQFGFWEVSLPSKNALIPIAYYLLRRGLPQDYAEADRFRDDRDSMRRWLILSLLRRVFSGNADETLRILRECMSDVSGGFPLRTIQDAMRLRRTPLTFADEELDGLLDVEYGSPDSWFLLSLLYPHVKFGERFHVDHLHPQAFFTTGELEKRGLTYPDIFVLTSQSNKLANLQLLPGVCNKEKSKKPLGDWIQKTYRDARSAAAYRQENFIPDVPLGTKDFPAFYTARRELLREQLRRIVQA
jgi:hypothetical protein